MLMAIEPFQLPAPRSGTPFWISSGTWQSVHIADCFTQYKCMQRVRGSGQ